MFFATSARCHAQAGLQAGEAVGGNAVDFVIFAEMVLALSDSKVATVRVFARQVEEVDAREDSEETAEE